MTEEARALQLYTSALALVEAKGAFQSVGLIRIKEYRARGLSLRYQPTIGWLDVWSIRKVLSVKQWNGTLRIIRYVPGPWEEELKKLAEQSAVSLKP
jgi:hypothetical protein